MPAPEARRGGQGTAAAERSAHPAEPAAPGRCFVCHGPWRKGGASAFAKAGAAFAAVLTDPPPVVEVCSAECAADPRFATPHRRTSGDAAGRRSAADIEPGPIEPTPIWPGAGVWVDLFWGEDGRPAGAVRLLGEEGDWCVVCEVRHADPERPMPIHVFKRVRFAEPDEVAPKRKKAPAGGGGVQRRVRRPRPRR